LYPRYACKADIIVTAVPITTHGAKTPVTDLKTTPSIIIIIKATVGFNQAASELLITSNLSFNIG